MRHARLAPLIALLLAPLARAADKAIALDLGDGVRLDLVLVEPGGPIDRGKLGAIVFADPAALRRLERIVHPAVHERIMAWLESLGARGQGSGVRKDSISQPPTPNSQLPIAVIDAIKLLESGWKQHCDAIWVVTCAPEQQVERLMTTRGLGESEARLRPGAHTEMQVAAGGARASIKGRLDRCYVAALEPIRYRGVIVFEQSIDI